VTTHAYSDGRLVQGEIEVTCHDPGVAIVTLRGEHDMAEQELLEKTLRTQTRAGELLIVDLSEADFIDSSVINLLFAADRSAQERGRRVVLQFGTSASVSRVLEVSGLTQELPCASTRDEAIQLARNGGS
jgi:anti-anti-sigma factor